MADGAPCSPCLQNKGAKETVGNVFDSTAKATGTLGDGFTTIAMDEKHKQRREQLKMNGEDTSSGHIVTGLKSFGIGIMGGITGVVTQPIRGAKEDGVGGFFKGLGKGLVGNVVKPVAGTLDLVSETASAVRMQCKSSSKIKTPSKEEQQLVSALNRGTCDETYVALEFVSCDPGQIQCVLITDQQLYLLSQAAYDPDCIRDIIPYGHMLNCRPLQVARKCEQDGILTVSHFVELTIAYRPDKIILIPCDKDTTSYKLSQQIVLGKSMYQNQCCP